MKPPIIVALQLPFFLIITINLSAQEINTFTDPRDGQSYATVSYEVSKDLTSYSMIWMAENLNYKMTDSYCLNDSVVNCAKYGRLYTWQAAKEACPAGWHLPTDEEWYQLADLYGGVAKAGKQLRGDKAQWVKGKSTGKSLFNGLPGGTRDPYDGRYHKYGTTAFFWSATEVATKPEEAYDWSFVSWADELRHWEGGKFIANSCRCVMDRVRVVHKSFFQVGKKLNLSSHDLSEKVKGGDGCL